LDWKRFRRQDKVPPRHRYRDHYDEDTRSIVADWYASEIKLLGCEF
jgi:hypothetical protein